MSDVQKLDTVLHHVWQAAKRWGVPADSMMTQQILLFGNSFYGYRFIAADFAAIWSAADHTVKVYDRKEQLLEIFSTAETANNVVRGLAMPSLSSLQRAA